MNLRSLFFTSASMLCSMLMAQNAVVVQGHIAGCSPAIAGGIVTIQSIQGTQPSVSVEVQLDENCSYQYTFGMNDTSGWFQVSGSCMNGAMNSNDGQYVMANGMSTVTIDLDCSGGGLVEDCAGVLGGSAQPGTACDDNDPNTAGDHWTADCDCIGTAIGDCFAHFSLESNSSHTIDFNNQSIGTDLSYSWQLPLGETSTDFEPETYTFPQINTYAAYGVCLTIAGDGCTSWHCDTVFVDPNGGITFVAPAQLDCEGVLGGQAMPGTPCDDGDPNTLNEHWTLDCECEGDIESVDCLGIVGGSAMPGHPCEDGDPNTVNEHWTVDCECEGSTEPVDCLGVAGGSALPGHPCDDGNPATGNDHWTEDCECVGGPVLGDCEAGYWVIQAFDSTNGQIEPIPFELWVWNLSTGNGGEEYLWSFGDGTSSTDPFPTHIYPTGGPYILCLTMT
ncbi:MAG: PKD domain-containing protein, partial [Bacteroidota bacterium]|nr:PKD domain-containing protein [Bacteroidota bacterium]